MLRVLRCQEASSLTDAPETLGGARPGNSTNTRAVGCHSPVEPFGHCHSLLPFSFHSPPSILPLAMYFSTLAVLACAFVAVIARPVDGITVNSGGRGIPVLLCF